MTNVYMLFQASEYNGRHSLNHAHFRGLFKTLDDARRYIEHNKVSPLIRAVGQEVTDPDIGGALSTDSGIWVWKYEVKVGMPYSDVARWIPDYYVVVRERVYVYPEESEDNVNRN